METVKDARKIGATAQPAVARPIRVLLLEDSARDAELCLLELKKAGFKVSVDAVDTEEAYAGKLQSNDYDVVLSDYRLPAWSGVEAFRLLKRSGKDIPFLLVTGTLGEEAAVDLIKEGLSDYILKDRLARLPSAIQRALDEKSSREERERATGALRESEELVRLLLDSTAEAIYGIDLQGNCTFCNAVSLRLLGYEKPADLLGKQMHQLMHHSRADGSLYPVEECRILSGFRSGKGSHEDSEVLWKKDGSSFPAEYWSYPVVRDGRTIGSVVTFLDVTERKRAEKALRRSEARLRGLVQSSIIGIGTESAQGQFLDANDALLNLLGYTREDVLSGKLRWDDMTPPEYRDVDRAVVMQLRNSGVAAPFEKELFRKDGRRVAVLIGLVMLEAEEGEPEAVSFVLDISERKKLEQQLRLAQKMEAIGQLAGGVAHDFNNLLSVIIGYTEIIMDSAGLNGSTRSHCEEIRKAGHRAALLTRQLLAFSRQQLLTPVVLNLNTVVEETEKMLRRLIGEDVELCTHLDPELGSVKADPGQIEQIIMNLAVNARDAMPEGGKMVIATSNADLDNDRATSHSPCRPGRYVLLTVSDSGAGMNEETKSHMFEPFFTTKEVGKGTGLGLAIVYGVVKQSGGYIRVQSEPGEGTAFQIYLPRLDEPARVERINDTSPHTYRGTETILLIEDDQAVRTLTRLHLEEGGYKVLEASNGVEALAMAEQYAEPIHLLMTDIVMPGMNGRALAQKMVQARPKIRVLYASGYTGGFSSPKELSDGGASVIQKPFSRTALLQKLRGILDDRGPAPG